MKKIFLVSLVILVALAIGAVSASENQTMDAALGDADDIGSDTSVETDIENDYNAEIKAKVNKNSDKIKVEIKDFDDPYNNAMVDKIKYKFDDGNVKTLDDFEDGDYGATYYIPLKLDPGSHKVEISIKDSYYKAKPLILNFKLDKKSPTIKAVKCTTTDEKVVLKATVKYNGKNLNEGKVVFKIKGKTYTVGVKNGVAIKKLKISRGYHKYKATFKSSKYYAKSSSSYAIKGKKYYTLKASGVDGKTYTIKIPFKKYLKLVNAKRNYVYASIKVKTGKTAKFIGTKDIYTTKTVYKWKKIKVLSYKSVSNSDWSDSTYYNYPLDKYFKNGWTLYGWTSSYSNNGHVYKDYAKLKKKVKTTEKVYVGSKTTYSSKSYPLRFTAGVNENGKLYCRWDISRESQLKANLIIPHWSGKL